MGRDKGEVEEGVKEGREREEVENWEEATGKKREVKVVSRVVKEKEKKGEREKEKGEYTEV